MKRFTVILFFSLYFLSASSQTTGSSQLIVVKTDGWNTVNGTLSAWERMSDQWKPVLENIKVVVGKNGLAWGDGLLQTPSATGKQKKEGDGNAPAGIFRLTGLFGISQPESKMDFLKSTATTYCVDDVKSRFYNQIVSTDTVRKDWNSAENMLLTGNQYKYGIFVDYNAAQPVPGKGSCIFMHIWKTSDEGTSGCTAMKERDLLKLIGFLDGAKNPLLVQVPQEEYSKLKKDYQLP